MRCISLLPWTVTVGIHIVAISLLRLGYSIVCTSVHRLWSEEPVADRNCAVKEINCVFQMIDHSLPATTSWYLCVSVEVLVIAKHSRSPQPTSPLSKFHGILACALRCPRNTFQPCGVLLCLLYSSSSRHQCWHCHWKCCHSLQL